MGDIITYNNYGHFKEAFDAEIKMQANSFVKVGYLLKVARDTNILYESGYGTVAEFAWNEYHLKKDAVSRYIAINDKFSVNGYSERIQDEYSEYGLAKLGEMLTLPEAVVEMMSPKLTRESIQELKRDLKEEEKISDIEVALEPVNTRAETFDTLAGKMLYEYFHAEREKYRELYQKFGKDTEIELRVKAVMQCMAPSGMAAVTSRLSGMGKILLSIKGETEKIEVLNIRANEKESYSWTEFIGELAAVLKNNGITPAEERWTQLYGEVFETTQEEPKVAPVQPQVKLTKTENLQQKPQKKEEKLQAQVNSTKTEDLEEKGWPAQQREITEYFDDKGNYKVSLETEEVKTEEAEPEEDIEEVAPVQQKTIQILKEDGFFQYILDGDLRTSTPFIDELTADIRRKIIDNTQRGWNVEITFRKEV